MSRICRNWTQTQSQLRTGMVQRQKRFSHLQRREEEEGRTQDVWTQTGWQMKGKQENTEVKYMSKRDTGESHEVITGERAQEDKAWEFQNKTGTKQGTRHKPWCESQGNQIDGYDYKSNLYNDNILNINSIYSTTIDRNNNLTICISTDVNISLTWVRSKQQLWFLSMNTGDKITVENKSASYLTVHWTNAVLHSVYCQRHSSAP